MRIKFLRAEQSRAEQSRAEQSRAEQSRAEQSRNPYIQIIRAFCIFAVVCIHTCPEGLPQVFIRPFINFGVGTFIFLSGYLTKPEKWDWKHALHRVERVLCPYIIWTLLYSIINGRTHRFLINLLTGTAAAQMYYIPVYIGIVIFTSFFLKAVSDRKFEIFLFFFSPLFLLFAYYIPAFNNIVYPIWINRILDICFLSWSCFFLLGLSSQKWHAFSLNKIIIIYFISLVSQIFEGYIWYKFGNSNCGTQMKVTSLITSCIFCLICHNYISDRNKIYSAKNGRFKSLFVLIGDYSFGIYLCHIAVIRTLTKIPGYKNIPYLVNSVIVLFISFLFCRVFDLLFQKIRCEKLSVIIGLK